MSRIKSKWMRMRLFKKINFIHIALTVTAMLALFFIQYSYLMPIINDYEEMLEKSAFDELNEYMGEIYGDMMGIVESMYRNKGLTQAIKSESEGGGSTWNHETSLVMDDFCSSVFRSYGGILDILFISNDNKVYHKSSNSNRTIKSNYDFSGDSILQDVREEYKKQGLMFNFYNQLSHF